MRFLRNGARKAAVVLCGLGVFLANPSWGEVPNLLNYQGRLTDPSGNPSNGTFSMSFAVFDAASGGNALPSGSPWGETQNVTVTDGTFHALLGSVTPLPSNLFRGGPADSAGVLRFLQVTINGEVLAPRRRIVSAAFVLSTEASRGSFVNFTSTLGYSGECKFTSNDVTSGDPAYVRFWGAVGCSDGQGYTLLIPQTGFYSISVSEISHFGPTGNRVLVSSVRGVISNIPDSQTASLTLHLTAGEEIWAYGTPGQQSNSRVAVSVVLIAGT